MPLTEEELNQREAQLQARTLRLELRAVLQGAAKPDALGDAVELMAGATTLELDTHGNVQAVTVAGTAHDSLSAAVAAFMEARPYLRADAQTPAPSRDTQTQQSLERQVAHAFTQPVAKPAAKPAPKLPSGTVDDLRNAGYSPSDIANAGWRDEPSAT